ncbi:unnamed protein product, partial [Didymodactylos carnosus]
MHLLTLSDGIINKRGRDDIMAISDGIKCCKSKQKSYSSPQSLITAPLMSFIPTTTASKEPKKSFNRERMNLESHQLIWLDENVNSSEYENQRITTTLRKIVDYTKQYLKQNDDIFSGLTSEDSTTDRLSSWWLPLINLLCQLSYPDHFHYRLVHSLQVYYENQNRELEILEEFKREYKPDTALRWYTRPIFLYRILNTASRQHNIELMFAFGFFVQDIYRQLKSEHEKLKHQNPEATVKVYRGQIMSQTEIRNLVHRLLQADIIINTLLSTSIDRSVSLFFLPQPSELSEGYQRVLFEIEANVRQHTNPFADISHLSYIEDESEILFMIGTKLKIAGGDIYYDEYDKIWIIKSKVVYTHSMINEMDFDDIDFHNTIRRRKLKLCIRQALYDSR